MFVYFLKIEARPEMMKIGMAADVQQRIKELQTGSPYKLLLLGALKCKSRAHAASIENQAHWIFRKRRVQGEWFRYTDEVPPYVRTILEGAADEMRERIWTKRVKKHHVKKSLKASRKLGEIITAKRNAHAFTENDKLDREFNSIMGGSHE